ncbi:ferrous iron transport protein B [Proteinivorax hydrogeniformans]|uniref:Ferrous iron transport protein B n=1 Tax=Proteinivorax hydrogeniformans TaxID=1826727 RepID=A0AAU8HVZ4_9FIRM
MRKQRLALVGNPNVGKSIFFNYLTGVYVEVSNYPGTTVDISKGQFKEYEVIDCPGVYGVSSYNDEEKVTRQVVLESDIILNVIDANHLERDLFLTLQLIDLGKPMIIALNMVDEAEKNGRKINYRYLSKLLNIPILPTVATKKKGFNLLLKSIKNAKVGAGDGELISMASKKFPAINHQERVLLLEEDEELLKKYKLKQTGDREKIYIRRRKRIEAITKKVVTEQHIKKSFKSKIDNYLLDPLWGTVVLFAVLYLMYLFIGDIVAQRIVDFTEGVLMGEYIQPRIVALITTFVNFDSLIGQLLVGEFGVFTLTVTYLLGLLLPLVIGFYLLLSIMEDSGYLPRVAVLLDKHMTKIGLNGKGIIPIILGFGCVTMAIISTRILGNKRERTIATFLLAISIPCSAQLGVIIGMIAPLGAKHIFIYITVMLAVFCVVGILLSLIVPGKTSNLILDLPTLRMPKPKNVIKKTYSKTIGFLQDASILFALGAAIITLLQYFQLLEVIQKFFYPITVNWLDLPKETANAFIMGLIRRDFGTAGLYNLSLTADQILVSLTTITLFTPCIASIMIAFKERGIFIGAITVVCSIVIAFFVGGLVAFIV